MLFKSKYYQTLISTPGFLKIIEVFSKTLLINIEPKFLFIGN